MEREADYFGGSEQAKATPRAIQPSIASSDRSATAVCALVGLLMVLLGGSTPVALVGALFWGMGASLGFPVGMSAAADDPARAAVRVSVVSSIGYTAFLAGPPLIGLLAEHNGILTALFVVVGALVLGLLVSGATRPLTPS